MKDTQYVLAEAGAAAGEARAAGQDKPKTEAAK